MSKRLSALRLTIWTLSLVAVTLAACAPAPSPVDPVQAADPPATEAVPPTANPTATTESAPIPVATSRGSQLVASDPAGVVLGTGRPALVEFFRFT
jgi:hypothetical protein